MNFIKIPAGKARDLTGSKANSFVVISRVQVIGEKPYKDNKPLWLCKCEICGLERIMPTPYITKGHPKCDTCLDNRILSKKFGHLMPIERVPVPEGGDSGRRYYLCQCDCGKTKITTSAALERGDLRSCGCYLKANSLNELTISSLLDSTKINYQSNYCFSDFPKRYYDFYIDNQYIIEYDGKQHFQSIKFFGAQTDFKKTLKRDLEKNLYCFKHDIPIIRIPYDAKYDEKDLKLETTRFLLTPENQKEYYETRLSGSDEIKGSD